MTDSRLLGDLAVTLGMRPAVSYLSASEWRESLE